jgi:hypothetical protein
MTYNPNNWYWIVAGSATQVWSSAQLAYVPITDPTYQAWLSGSTPTNIASAAELIEVMQNQVVAIVQSAGVTITSTATPALNGTYDIGSDARGNATAVCTGVALGKPLPSGGATLNYPDVTGQMHAFASADFVNFALAIEGYIYEFDQALAALISGVSAALPSSALTIP